MSLVRLYDALKVSARSFYIHCDGLLLYFRVVYNHHDIGAGGELVYDAGELLVFNDHRLELEVSLDARQLKLLYNV